MSAALEEALLLRAGLRLLHGAVPTAEAACAAWLAALSPETDIVAALLPGTRLERTLQQMVPPERLFRLALPPRAAGCRRLADPELIAAVAGAQDLDIPAEPVLPWPQPSAPGWRMRRLDTLFPHPGRIGLIVTDEAAGAAALLRGAATLLRQDVPAVVIDLSALPPNARLAVWADCDAALAGSAHRWHDGLLLPCTLGPLLPEQLHDAVVCALPASAGATMIERLAQLGWRAPVPPPPPAAARSEVTFDAALAGFGFHPPQADRNGACRWSGAGPLCGFAIALPGPGRWDLRLEVHDWGVVRSPSELQLGLEIPGPDGAAALRWFTGLAEAAGRIRFEGIVVPGDDARGQLVFHLATRRPAGRVDDGRPRGICLSRATLEGVR